jgi:putative FmdB family regulatory protein
MPTYEYRCQKGHDFEVMQRIADDPVLECEVCGAPVRRVFSAPAVHFKGTGFYNTDYGTKSRARELKETAEANKAKKAKEESKSSSDSGSAKSDSTSSKTETKASSTAD